MRTYILRGLEFSILVAIAIGAGVGFAWADITDGGNLNIGGNGTIGGSLTVNGGAIAMAGGTNSTDDLVIYRDFFGNSGIDWMAFNAGSDTIAFEPNDGDNDATILFEFNPSFLADNDLIFYDSGSGTNNDLLTIASDSVTIESNNGDVVIQLGD